MLPTTQLFVIFVIFKGRTMGEWAWSGSKAAAAKTHLIPACAKWAQSKLLTFQPRQHDTPVWVKKWVKGGLGVAPVAGLARAACRCS